MIVATPDLEMRIREDKVQGMKEGTLLSITNVCEWTEMFLSVLKIILSPLNSF
jgi:hypothetical protein